MMNKEKETKNITAKILAIQSEIESIAKLSYNAFHKYYYFTELQVLKALKSLLVKHQLTLMLSDDPSQPFLHEKEEKEHLVKYCKKMVISDGTNSLEFSFWAAGGNQDLAKAKGAAETYALKYLLSKFFLIPIMDKNDPDYHEEVEAKPASPKEDSQTPEVSSDSQQFLTTLVNKLSKQTKSGEDYLILNLANGENVYVFPSDVPIEQWDKLVEGQLYEFAFKVGNKEKKVLTNYLKKGKKK